MFDTIYHVSSHLYHDYLAAKKHRCYGMSVDEIYNDLKSRVEVHDAGVIIATSMLVSWFANAEAYWENYERIHG